MCIVCINWQKAKMNIKEIDRALSELVELSTSEEEIEHYLEILEELKEKLE